MRVALGLVQGGRADLILVRPGRERALRAAAVDPGDLGGPALGPVEERPAEAAPPPGRPDPTLQVVDADPLAGPDARLGRGDELAVDLGEEQVAARVVLVAVLVVAAKALDEGR